MYCLNLAPEEIYELFHDVFIVHFSVQKYLTFREHVKGLATMLRVFLKQLYIFSPVIFNFSKGFA